MHNVDEYHTHLCQVPLCWLWFVFTESSCFQSFVEAANYLIENPPFRNKIISAGKKYIKENHSCDSEKQSYLALFERLNKLRPTEDEIAMIEEEEQMFDGLTASTASVDLAVVAAANSPVCEKAENGVKDGVKDKKKMPPRKGSKASLNIRRSSDENQKLTPKDNEKPRKGSRELTPELVVRNDTTSSESSIQSDSSLSQSRDARVANGDKKDMAKKKSPLGSRKGKGTGKKEIKKTTKG